MLFIFIYFYNIAVTSNKWVAPIAVYVAITHIVSKIPPTYCINFTIMHVHTQMLPRCGFASDVSANSNDCCIVKTVLNVIQNTTTLGKNPILRRMVILLRPCPCFLKSSLHQLLALMHSRTCSLKSLMVRKMDCFMGKEKMVGNSN